MLKVLDNFLPQNQFKPIQDFFFSGELYWLWNDSIAGENDSLNNFQFNHVFFNTRNPYLDRKYSPYCNYLKPIFIKLAPMYMLRVKANLRPRTSFPHKANWHTDIDIDSLTAIYYMNSNNGYTEFESGEIVNTVENRIVIFNSNLNHRGVSCTDQKRRIVLNINYVPGTIIDGSKYIPDQPMNSQKILKIYMKAQECTSRDKAKKLIKKYNKKIRRISILNDY